MEPITIRGARLHNLKNIDVTLPKNKLVVVTGVSGSGKSTLAFDIVFQEGRKQYLRSLGILQGLEDEEKFDSITGLAPAIAVQQSVIRQSNPRSTVGSRTGVLGMLAMLFAGEGLLLCSACGAPTDRRLQCSRCRRTEERLQASYFLYSAPNGMCLKCSGRGATFEINLHKLAPAQRTTLRQVLERAGVTPGYVKVLARRFKESMEEPFAALPEEARHEAIHGSRGPDGRQSFCLTRFFQARLRRSGGDCQGLYTSTVCAECQGTRIGPEARRVLLDGRHIGELGLMSLGELRRFLEALPEGASFTALGKGVRAELVARVRSLEKARLGHLTLYREMPTLSGGELQRLFLHSHLDSRLDSLIYVLDEPTTGLHESEKQVLLESLRALRDLGNTVIVVEHDPNTIALADHIVDIGPKAGTEGGRVVYQGRLPGLRRCKGSLTSRYLSWEAVTPRRAPRPGGGLGREAHLTLRHARTNNLKDVTLSLPLGCLVGVAGVSGSGKSSLMSATLIPLLEEHFRSRRAGVKTEPVEDVPEEELEPLVPRVVAEAVEGLEHLAGYVEVSQEPIGRHSNSNPATYLGLWDRVRELFAERPEAVRRGLSAGHFSFNSKGACPGCGGGGRKTVWIGGDFSFEARCDECHGKRYSEQALSVVYRGKTVAEVLAMRVGEAISFFEDCPGVRSMLEILERIGMGYLELGQPAPSLSGGEAQRLKLAKELGRRRPGHQLYLLDEPTTGLSHYDTVTLLELLDELVAKGNSVIVVEHDPAVLSSCDWIVELGPGGGAEGGRGVAEGTPSDLKKQRESVTGPYLLTEPERPRRGGKP